MDALQHRRNALQPHAGVDARPRQVDARAARLLIVLHEHQVPDLDEAVAVLRSEEHTSELQSLMRISYAVFCLKKKKYKHRTTTTPQHNREAHCTKNNTR